jgi:GPI mannosyltransferase 3
MNKYKFLTNPHYLLIFTSFLTHLIASYTSIGFYSMDEHYQILEPLAHKLNLRDIHIYEIWEFGNGLRPWTQVYIFFYIIKFLQFFSIEDPFVWVLVIKFFLSVLGFFSIYILYNFLIKKKLIEKNYFNTYIFFFFWFLIFFHSRTSSENFSISIFIIGFVLLFSLEKINYKNIAIFITVGLLFGLSILLRYQLVFILIPFFLWLWIYYFNFIKVFSLGLLIILCLILGLIIDFYGYGNFINTYYNYYYFNLVVGIFDGFGIEPWWYYISELIIKFSPPIGLFFLLGMFIFWFKNFSNFITWVTLPYFIIFTYLGHKELRFIFPIMIFVPFFIVYFFDFLSIYKLHKSILISKIIFISINFIFFITLIIPAERQIGLQRFISQNTLNSNNMYYYGENPYIIDGLNPYFYTHYLPEIKNIELQNGNFLEKEKINLYQLVTNNYSYYRDYLEKNINCKKIYSSYPENIILLNKNWRERNLNWYVIECN